MRSVEQKISMLPVTVWAHITECMRVCAPLCWCRQQHTTDPSNTHLLNQDDVEYPGIESAVCATMRSQSYIHGMQWEVAAPPGSLNTRVLGMEAWWTGGCQRTTGAYEDGTVPCSACYSERFFLAHAFMQVQKVQHTRIPRTVDREHT